MSSQFSKKEAVRFGWHTWKANIVFFLAVLLTTWIISAIPNALESALGKGSALDSIIRLVSWIFSVVVGIGTTKIALAFARGQKPDFNELFTNYPLFFKYLFGSILYAVIVTVGLLLLVVPGVIWAIKFHFFSYFIVDKGVGPIEALKRSSQLTKGVKGELLVFMLLLVGINILGLIVIFIGLLATIPLSMVAVAFVYYKLLAQTDSSASDSGDGTGRPEGVLAVPTPVVTINETNLASPILTPETPVAN